MLRSPRSSSLDAGPGASCQGLWLKASVPVQPSPTAHRHRGLYYCRGGASRSSPQCTKSRAGSDHRRALVWS
eukprot:1894096-Pleurochrysis_carterae.AAC.2